MSSVPHHLAVRSCYFAHTTRYGRLLIVPVGADFELRLGAVSLGRYSTAALAADDVASGHSQATPEGLNLLRLDAPFDLDRWDKLPMTRTMQR